ncbi:MAG: hypothetical protein AAB447_00305 [Patescibacteria group bacterium]
MDTSNSKTAEVVRTTTEKILILRGTQKVKRKEMSMDDWFALITELVRDYKPYLKYLHELRALEEHARITCEAHTAVGDKIVSKNVPKVRVKVTLVCKWQHLGFYDKYALLISSEGDYFVQSICWIKGDPKEKRWAYKVEALRDIYGLHEHFKRSYFSNSDLGVEIVRGLFDVFDRSVKHKQELIRKLELARDQLQTIVSHRLVE